jgi:predicted acylesterase/phospholipase RssA
LAVGGNYINRITKISRRRLNMPVAIALSGGGALGDFQVGAVRYLYDQGHFPDIISGSSVGAINGSKLAEGRGDAAMSALRELESIWLDDMRENSDMWLEEAWLVSFGNSPVTKFLRNLAAGYQLPLDTGTIVGESLVMLINPVQLVMNVAALFEAGGDISDFMSIVRAALAAKSLNNLNPIHNLLLDTQKFDPAKVQNSGVTLRLAMVSLEAGTLRYVTEQGRVIEPDRCTRELNPVLGISTECQQIVQAITTLENAKLALQRQLSTAPPSEKPELIMQIREVSQQIQQQRRDLTTCRRDRPGPPVTVQLPEAILASASIPMYFPPVQLAGDNYVDGGVREIMPIEAAVLAGATEVYAIHASAAAVDPLPSFNQAKMLEISTRVVLEIMPNETALGEIYPPPAGWNTNIVVIQPLKDIHDILTIDPGLIRIRMAHGYMRADDVLQARAHSADPCEGVANQYSDERHTEEIVKLRKRIWEEEYRADGRDVGNDEPLPTPIPIPNLAALEVVRRLKMQLRELVDDRRARGGAVPDNIENWGRIEDWWEDWEKHKWSPRIPLWPTQQRTLQASLLPTNRIPLGVPVIGVQVRAVDGATQEQVPGTVVIVQYGRDGETSQDRTNRTNTQFDYTFRMGRRRVLNDDDPRHPRWEWEEAEPQIFVVADEPSYRQTPVSLEFLTPQLTTSVEVLSNPPIIMVGEQVTIRVRVTDSDSGQQISGRVKINNQDVAATNTEFNYVFNSTDAVANVEASGYPSARITLNIRPSNRERCEQIRQSIEARQRTIAQLQERLDDMECVGPQERICAGLRRQIQENQRQIQSLRGEANQLGCQ